MRLALIVEIIISFIRGLLVKILIHITCPGSKIGKRFRIGKNCRIRIRKHSKMIIGDNVTLGDGVKLSVLNGGELIVGEKVFLGDYCQIVSHKCITVEHDCNIAPFVCMFDHDHVYTKENGVESKQFTTKPIIIKANSWIAVNTVILKGTVIGEKSVIGAGSVVKKEVPSNTMVIQKRQSSEYSIGI